MNESTLQIAINPLKAKEDASNSLDRPGGMKRGHIYICTQITFDGTKATTTDSRKRSYILTGSSLS